ncbi:MAG: MBL fold metallo-hydrolase [Chitinispirillaceae bacterium]
MFIRCWGSRGGLPVSGPDFIRYGGDTTCIEVRSDNKDTVIIDAGTGIRNLGNSLNGDHNIRNLNLLFTHAHLDHIMGFPFFAPIYSEQTELSIFGSPCKNGPFETVLKEIMRNPYFPVDFDTIPSKVTFQDLSKDPFHIGSLKIIPIMLNHPNGGNGFRIEENNTSFVFLTDNELEDEQEDSRPTEYYQQFCKDADLLFHDAEFTEEEYPRFTAWGHSKYTDAAELAIQSKVSRFGLFHLNNRRTDDQMDELVKCAQDLIRSRGADTVCFGVRSNFQISL